MSAKELHIRQSAEDNTVRNILLDNNGPKYMRCIEI